MLGVLSAKAIFLGITGGALGSGLFFALAALAARTLKSEAVAGLAVSLSVLVGFGVGSFVAGRMALVNGRFHGSITALLLGAIVIVVASIGGSPAPLGSVLLLALIAIVIGGIGGSLGVRRGASRIPARVRRTVAGAIPRKVRTPQGTVLGNAQAGQPDG